MKNDSEEDNNIKELTESAENGDITSQYLLGCWHCNVHPDGLSDRGYYCLFDKRDITTGISWLKKSAYSGNIESQRKLGVLYFNGCHKISIFDIDRGIKNIIKIIISELKKKPKEIWKNNKEAENWFNRAAESGDAISQYTLGSYYISGEIGKKDFVKGEELLIRAAESSSSVGYQYDLGLRYANESRDFFGGQPYKSENHLKLNLQKAEHWFVKAAENDALYHDRPMYKYDLARRYFYGVSGFEKDYKKAKYWLEQCLDVKDDFPEALYLLGLMFSDGLGCDQDSKVADDYFSKIQSTYSFENLPYFMDLAFEIFYTLFCKYADGIGVPYDFKKTVFWSDCFNELYDERRYLISWSQEKKRKIIAKRFKTGDGVPVDIERAGRY